VPTATIDRLALRHFRVGWWALVVFLALGLFLESMHGFKVGAYLDVSNGTRRTMWTLAHAHGGILSILQIAFAATLRLGGTRSLADPAQIGQPIPARMTSWLELASRCFLAALFLMPLGFFLGGVFIFDGDPGLGILLVPPGAALLIVAVALTARAIGSVPRPD
jgi:hypothetical protein